jgi:ribosomal protein S18 acetylase RimI-like enzyme
MAARGLVRLQLQLGVDNLRGRAFYERHGFRRRAGYELFDKPL